MTESRKRHKHPPPVQPHHVEAKPKRSAALVLAILAAIAGLAIVYFTRGADIFWMIIGAASGAAAGYIIGHNMDKAIEKDK